MFGPIPDSFPLAWRDAPPPEQRQPTASTSIASDERLTFVREALSHLPSVRQASAAATEAVTERIQSSCPLRRVLAPRAAHQRDTRAVDQRCMPAMELCMRLQTASEDEMDELGRVLQRIARVEPNGEEDDTPVRRAVYESLSRVPGVLDALRRGAGDELAPLFAGIAAAHGSSSATNTATAADTMRRVCRRVRTAGAMLREARRERADWTVLLDPHGDIDNRLGLRRVRDDDDAVSITAAVALGRRAPLTTDAAQTPHSFVAIMERLVSPRRSWTLADTLIPCEAVPIRTRHYVAFLQAVAEFANRQLAKTVDQACAWALCALASPSLYSEETFRSFFELWRTKRAHEPPCVKTDGSKTHKATEAMVVWIVARALLGQAALDVPSVASLVCASAESSTCARVAALCVATRTPNGLRMVAHEPKLAAGWTHADLDCLDCLSYSPSGTLEFAVYENGWSEFPQNESDDAERIAERIAEVAEREMRSALAQEDPRRATSSVLRLSLLPENLVTRPWRRAVEAVQPALEGAMQRVSGGGRVVCVACVACDDDFKEDALRAVVFRKRCLRALCDASRHAFRGSAALVAWLSTDAGTPIVFARAFAANASTESESVVIEFERLLRCAVGALELDDAPNTALITPRGARVSCIQLSDVTFADDASRDALAGMHRLGFCTENVMLVPRSCAVSVVYGAR